MIKNILKFLAGGILIAAVTSSILASLGYFAAPKNSKIKAPNSKDGEKNVIDSYGGKTSEETLALFISALKKDDTNLAAKYFIPEAQKNWQEQLSKIQEKGLFKDMVTDMETLTLPAPERIDFMKIGAKWKIIFIN